MKSVTDVKDDFSLIFGSRRLLELEIQNTSNCTQFLNLRFIWLRELKDLFVEIRGGGFKLRNKRNEVSLCVIADETNVFDDMHFLGIEKSFLVA